MILVTLLGDDLNYINPVFFEFKDKVKKHILIYDDAPHEEFRAKQLQNGLKKFVKSKNLNTELHNIKIDEDSKTDMLKVYEQIKALKDDSTIYLNSTQGYASTSFILSNIVLKDGGKIINYDLIDNEYNLIEGENFTTHKVQNSMNLDEYMIMMNYKIVAEQTNHHNKQNILKLFNNYTKFDKVKTALVRQDKEFAYTLYRDVLEILESFGIVDETHKIIPSKQMELQGSLFEEYVFFLCKSLVFDDIKMGVKIDFDQLNDNSTQQEHILNEFDILMIKNNKIFTIECKLSNNLEGLELVYKYDAIMDYFGADTKAILLNISKKEKKKYLNSKRSDTFNRSSIRRAISSNMHIYHENILEPVKFTNLVTNFFK